MRPAAAAAPGGAFCARPRREEPEAAEAADRQPTFECFPFSPRARRRRKPLRGKIAARRQLAGGAEPSAIITGNSLLYLKRQPPSSGLWGFRGGGKVSLDSRSTTKVKVTLRKS